MAKKKTASTKSKTAAGKSAKAGSGKTTKAPKTKTEPKAKTKAKASTASVKPSLSDELIGNAAGKVWHTLTAGEQTLAALKKSVDSQPELVLAALGWLAREGKLDFVTSGRSLKIALR